MKNKNNRTTKFLSLNVILCPCLSLNDAPVKGYENDVGSKTTMRFFYPESASDDPGLHNEPDTLMVLVPFKQQDLQWLKEILYNEKRVEDMCENALSLTQTHTHMLAISQTFFLSLSPAHKHTPFSFFYRPCHPSVSKTNT